jgi:GNAT superfamily N-acetyltransferase
VDPVPGLVVEEVLDDKGVELFETTWDQENGPPPWGGPGRLDARSLGGGLRLWIALLDGTAVATAAGFEHAGTNFIKNVTTLDGYRSRGIGAALSAHALASSRHPALLDSAPAAEKLYRRLGFRESARVTWWTV